MSMTIGEVRHMAVVEAQLRRIADAMEGIFKAVHDMASEANAEIWDSDALDDINYIVFGDEKQEQKGEHK